MLSVPDQHKHFASVSSSKSPRVLTTLPKPQQGSSLTTRNTLSWKTRPCGGIRAAYAAVLMCHVLHSLQKHILIFLYALLACTTIKGDLDLATLHFRAPDLRALESRAKLPLTSISLGADLVWGRRLLGTGTRERASGRCQCHFPRSKH